MNELASADHGITAHDLFQLNPNLVVWPSPSLVCGIVDRSDEIRHVFDLPVGALRVLKAFALPAAISDVFRKTSGETLSTMRWAVSSGLLMKQEDRNREGPRIAKYAGFYLSDTWPGTSYDELQRHVTRQVDIDDKRLVVLDGLLERARHHSVFRWVMQLPYKFIDIDSYYSIEFRHWICPFSPASDSCESVPLLRFLTSVGRGLMEGPNLKVRRSHVYCVPYGDVPVAHSDVVDEFGVTVLYFGNALWEEAWGSEMLFFGSTGEPEIAVALKPGRIVVFHGDIRHRAGSPMRHCNEARYTVVVRLGLPRESGEP